MTHLRGRILLPLTLLCLLALAGTVGLSILLDASAERARDEQEILEQAQALAEAASPTEFAHVSCLGVLVRAVRAARPDVSYVRVEDGRGAVLSEAGDREEASALLIRTFGTPRGAVTVRVGYRPRTQPVARVVRAGVWGALSAGFFLALLGTASLLLGRHAVAPIESVSRWLEGRGDQPEARTAELDRLIRAARKRLRPEEPP